MIAVVVSGASGRLGRRIVAAAAKATDLTLAAGLVRAGSSLDGAELGAIAGVEGLRVRATSDAGAVMAKGRVLIAAAPRSASVLHARLAASAGMPILVATTGFGPEERAEILAHAEKVPVLIAPNLSPGVAVLSDLVRRASRALAGYDLEVLEVHHNKKRDAPSGTAWALAREAALARGQDVDRDAILARAGEIGPRGVKEIGIQSLRGGDVIGDHTVFLFGENERIEITHRALSRDVFAEGAIRAARFLGAEGRAPGAYGMADVLGLGELGTEGDSDR